MPLPKEVTNPDHYQGKYGMESIRVIDEFFADDWYLGNVFKYICRWKKKGGLLDLLKAQQLLTWRIEAELAEQKRREAGEDA